MGSTPQFWTEGKEQFSRINKKGAANPTFLQHPSKGSPIFSPQWVHPWREMAFSCPSLGHGEWSEAPQVPSNSLYIYLNIWDFNGVLFLMTWSLSDSPSVFSPEPALSSSIYFTLFFWFYPVSSSRFPFTSPIPSALDLYMKLVSINWLE